MPPNTFLMREKTELQPLREGDIDFLEEKINTLLKNYYVTLISDSKAYARNNSYNTINIRPYADTQVMNVMRIPHGQGDTIESTPKYTRLSIDNQEFVIWYMLKETTVRK